MSRRSVVLGRAGLLVAILPSLLLAGVPLLFVAGSGPAPRAAIFTDVAPAAGVENLGAIGNPLNQPSLNQFPSWNDWLRALDMWGGAAWGDYDGDGWEDLYLAHRGQNTLHRNNGDGTFTDVTAAAGAGVTGQMYGATFADYDDDRDLDILTTNFWGPNTLLRNNGDGTFTNVTAAAGMAGHGRDGSGMAWADYDNDGDLDVAMTYYTASPDALYRNNGDGTFTDVAPAVGVTETGYGFQPVWVDYDDDDDPDLFIVNDFGPDMLFRNVGNGTFANATTECRCSGGGAGGMGGSTGDLDGDGFPEFYVTNFRHNDLWRNLGDGRFTDVSQAAAVDNSDVGWGTSVLDYDLDGDLDLHVANGLITSGTHSDKQPDLLYRNDGNLRFTDVASALGVANEFVARGSSVADFDNDGDVDIYVVNLDARSSLYRNDLAGGNWIQVLLRGNLSNSFGIGARIEVTTAAGTQVREVQDGSSYLSQDSLVETVGIGTATTIERITVRWPSGVDQVLTNVTHGQRLTVSEPVAGIIARGGPDWTVLEDTDLSLDASGTTFPAGDPGTAVYTWTVVEPGGNRTFTGKTATVPVPEPGRFPALLTVRDGLGNVDTDRIVIRVQDRTLPVAVAAAHPAVVPQRGEVKLDGQNSTDNNRKFPGEGAFTWAYDSGAGPVVLWGIVAYTKFERMGTYAVNLSVTDPAGNAVNDTVIVTVLDTDAPIADAGPDRIVNEDTPVLLSADASLDNDPAFATTGTFTWSAWTLRNGTQSYVAEGVIGRQVPVVFPEPGTYQVRLVATDARNNSANDTASYTVLDATPPSVGPCGNMTVPEDETAVLDCRTRVSDNDPGFPNNGVSWQWSIDEPAAASPGGFRHLELEGAAIGHRFPDPGVATVTLAVTDARGNTGKGTFQVTVRDTTAPTVDVGPDRTVDEDTEVLVAPSVADNGPGFPAGATFRWRMQGIGLVEEREGQNLSFTFATPGTAEVRLTVTDAGGMATSDSMTVVVRDRTAPVIVLPAPPTGDVNGTFALVAGVTDNDPSFPSTGKITWSWVVRGRILLADGATATARFPDPGKVRVTVEAVDAGGNTANASYEIVVTGGGTKPPNGDKPPGGNGNNTVPGPVDPTGPGLPAGVVYGTFGALLAAIVAAIAIAVRRRPPPGRSVAAVRSPSRSPSARRTAAKGAPAPARRSRPKGGRRAAT